MLKFLMDAVTVGGAVVVIPKAIKEINETRKALKESKRQREEASAELAQMKRRQPK